MLPALALLAVRSLTLYVSPTGDDANTGTSQSHSLRTLRHAIEIAKGRPHAVIHLAPGSYPIDATLHLTRENEGLTIDGGKGKLPHLTGGVAIGGWRPSDGHVLVADIPAGIDLGHLSRRGFGLPRQAAGIELIFDGQPMTLAQYPDEGWLRTGKVTSPKSFSYQDDVPKTWRPTDDAWVLGFWSFDWAESYEHVAKLTPTEVTTDEQGGTYGYKEGRRFRFVNVREALDKPGEYYVDRQARKLYFWPPKPLAGRQAVVSVLQTPMLDLQDARNVTLRNLCLENGRDSAIVAEHAQGVQIEDSLIRNFGTYGVALNACKDSWVKGCDLTGLGESGITLDGGDRKTLTPGNLVAENDHVWAYSRWTRTYQPAVVISGVGNKILNCRIHDAPHEAIALGGNEHLIEWNDISRVCLETGDAGAIYMGRDPAMRGNVVRHNRFTGIGPKITTDGNYTGVMSVYLDDCWCGTTVDSNVFDTPGTGIMIGGGRDNRVLNNLFLGCHPAIHFDARGKGWAKDMFANTTEWGFHQRFDAVDAGKPPYTVRYPQLATYWEDDPGFPKGNVIARNVDLGGQWMTLLDGLTDKDYAGGGNVVEPKAIPLDQALKRLSTPIPIARIGALSSNRPISRG